VQSTPVQSGKNFCEAKIFCENLLYTPRQAYNQHLRKSAQSAGDKTSLLPRKVAKEAKAQRIFSKQKYSAKICCSLCVMHTINPHLRKSAQSAGDKTSLLPRKAAKEASEVSEGAKDFFEAKIFCENLLFTPRQAYNQHRRKSA
jgi:hypothetical protein